MDRDEVFRYVGHAQTPGRFVLQRLPVPQKTGSGREKAHFLAHFHSLTLAPPPATIGVAEYSDEGGGPMAGVTEEMIHDMASVIARQISPEAIILFGSQATDRAEVDSDVDLMVIESAPYGPGNDRRQRMTLLWKALAKYPVSKDILVYSRDEVDRWRDARNHIIPRALKEGRFLYGALR